MRFVTSHSDPRREMDRLIAEMERVNQNAIRTATNDVKLAWRAQIVGAGLGQRLGNTIRADVYPKGQNTMNAAGFLHSKAPNIISSFESGAVIKARNARFLVIPTAAAGGSRGRQSLTPADWERRTGLKLRLVLRPGKNALLVADGARISKSGRAVRKGGRRRADGILRGEQSAVMFVLVPQARIAKRLDLIRQADAIANALYTRLSPDQPF